MKSIVVKLIGKEVDLKVGEIESLIEVPPSLEMGDFAFPCFGLAKSLKKSPIEISRDLAKKFSKKLPKSVVDVKSEGPYVNFFVDRGIFAEGVFSGKKKRSKSGKKMVIEFSQPNTHKAFHVGHIRGTSLGESLARIFEWAGDKVVRLNYSGDTGMHIAKWIWCYRNFHKGEDLRDDEAWIASIYTEAVKRLGENEDFQEEVDEINRKIESREDSEINELWEKTRELSIKSWEKIYSELGTHFDKHYFEGEVELSGKKIAEELAEKGIAKKDDAIFMDLKEFGLGVWVLLRRDGSVLYSAKDLELARRKLKEFPANRYLICIGDEQRMHFEQLKKTLELMDFEKRDVYDFLTFAMVRLPSGKMSSRTGQNVLYSDFMEEVAEVARKGLEDRGADGKDIEKRALKIAVSAVKYAMLKQDTNKVIIFDPKKATSFEGDTGPYLLYSYARASSILRKVKSKKKNKIVEIGDVEFRLLKKIGLFDDVVEKAYVSLAPNLIANYCFELARDFNEFYHACPVLGGESEGFRLAVVDAFRAVLGKGLDLLGIEKLEEM